MNKQEFERAKERAKKALKFVEHIETHLKNDVIRFGNDAEVMCKICGKTIDQIAEERIIER